MRYPDCWWWDGSYGRGGYGIAWSTAKKGTMHAHRFIYEQFYGLIPEGMQLDHMCRNRSCVCPYHLRVVTCRENVHAPGSRCVQAINLAKTHCPVGHPYASPHLWTSKFGVRHCRTCLTEKQRLRRASALGARPSQAAGRSSGTDKAV